MRLLAGILLLVALAQASHNNNKKHHKKVNRKKRHAKAQTLKLSGGNFGGVVGNEKDFAVRIFLDYVGEIYAPHVRKGGLNGAYYETFLTQLETKVHHDYFFTDTLPRAFSYDHPIYQRAVKLELVPGVVVDKGLNTDYNCDDTQCDIPLDLRGVWQYGCYCNFGSELTKGKGSPMNVEDSICKRMQLCLRCAEMDAGNGGYDCNAKTVTYNSTLGQSLPSQNSNENSFNSGCRVQNPNDLCAAHVCTCEMQLVNEFLELFWMGNTHDPRWRHPDNPFGGSFIWEDNCYSNPGVTEIDCCGRYPFRYTFNSLDKDCCENTQVIFSPFDQQCCADGVKQLGEAC